MYTTTISLDAGVIQEVLSKSLNYDAWLRAEVQKGIDAADRGDFISQEEMDDVVRGMGIRVH